MKIPIWPALGDRCSCPASGACRSPAKHPRTVNGLKDARADWGDEYEGSNWALVTGAESGVVVIDLDRKPGKDGVASFRALGTVPRTRTVRTGSGGLHLYFRHPGGRVPNSSGKLGLGIDVRGDGGYVLSPGSNHVSGGTYELLIDAPEADLPEHLITQIRAPAYTAIPSSGIAAVRGYFPPASPSTLADARQALEDHGPAIEGRGGDDHTFRAGAILTHDFALTDDEAWPLLVEWNETCQPPWPESDLRAKLRGGAKYGTRPYGCERSLDAQPRATKRIADWQASGSPPEQILAVVKDVREICKAGVDPATRTLIEIELESATGLPKRALDLPKVKPPTPRATPKPGEIEVTPELAILADKATAAIAGDVFHRNGVLCEVVKPDNRLTFISELQTPRIQDLMSRRSQWYRDEDGTRITQIAPLAVATILHSRRVHTGIRPLDAVTTAPIFLADGSILQERGYSDEARVYLEPDVTVDVPEAPSRDDARAAAALLHGLVSQFQFRERADFSSWLAALLSPLVKTATGNAPAPLVCISASTPGAGKSLLADLIAQIVTGEKAELSPYNPKDPAEWGKRLTAFVKAASPVRVLDNCNGPIGDESLERLITSSRWSDRILGASEAPPLPNVTTWLATGNNIEPTGDLVRRVLVCRIETNTDRPQERSGFRLDLEGGYAVEHRSELLGAALTILRAWHVAERPRPAFASWGSFTTWSGVVRSALMWLGMADPYLTQHRATLEFNETDNVAHDFWLGVINDSIDGSERAVSDLANSRQAADVLGLRGQINPHNVRSFVARFVDKPRKSRRIRRELNGRFYVETIDAAPV